MLSQNRLDDSNTGLEMAAHRHKALSDNQSNISHCYGFACAGQMWGFQTLSTGKFSYQFGPKLNEIKLQVKCECSSGNGFDYFRRMPETNILIAYPIDHASIFLGMQFIEGSFIKVYYIGHKLMTSVDNKVTIYLDQRIENDFMSHVVGDLSALTNLGAEVISSQVCIL